MRAGKSLMREADLGAPGIVSEIVLERRRENAEHLPIDVVDRRRHEQQREHDRYLGANTHYLGLVVRNSVSLA